MSSREKHRDSILLLTVSKAEFRDKQQDIHYGIQIYTMSREPIRLSEIQ